MTREELEKYLKSNISALDSSKIDSFEHLMNVTLDTNKLFNLTAIKDEERFRELMIYDSLMPLKYISFDGKRVLDVGTGGGFPGLPLAIATNGNFVLLDSTKKKIDYINDYIVKNNINNAIAVCYRAEDYVEIERENFDIVVARAVAPLVILVELTLPFVKVGGSFIALKGDKVVDEIKMAKPAIQKLGGEIVKKEFDVLPISQEKRYYIEIKKIKETPKKYPRQYSEIKNRSL